MVRLALIVAFALAACAPKLNVVHLRELGDEPDIPAPGFEGTDHTGARVALSEVLARGPVVLVFYRGHW